MATGVVGFGIAKMSIPLGESLTAWFVVGASLLPMLLWTAAPRAYGLPVFPVYALIHLMTYGFAFLDPNVSSAQYSAEARQSAAFLVALFLLVGTMAWLLVAGRQVGRQRNYEGMGHRFADRVFISILLIAPLFFHASNAGYISVLGPLGAIAKSLMLTGTLLALFYVGVRWARSAFPIHTRVTVVFAVAAFCFVNAASLLLNGAVVAVMFIAIGYFVGGGRVPATLIWVTFAIAGFLNLGKQDIRNDCWNFGRCGSANYVQTFGLWIGHSLDRLVSPDLTGLQEATFSVFDRSSLTQLFLLVRTKSPDQVPYLNGESYAVIPQLMVPRIINPNRADTHEGTTLLNIHYGVQSRESTQHTTVGWGLLNEAYANYGVSGIVCLGILMGLGLGAASSWARHSDILTLPSLFCLVLIGLCLNTEASAGIFITSLGQATVALIMLHLVLRGSRRNADSARRAV